MGAFLATGGNAMVEAAYSCGKPAHPPKPCHREGMNANNISNGNIPNSGHNHAQHLAALKQYGVLPEHRRDFAPVKCLPINRNPTGSGGNGNNNIE